MKKLKKTLSFIWIIALFIAMNFIVFNTTTYAEISGGDWKVVCTYNGSGTLLGYTCTSGGDHDCGCF